MSIKYLSQLSDEEILNMHKKLFCDDIEDELLKVESENHYGEKIYSLVFYENWPDEDDDGNEIPQYIETLYEYSDFEKPISCDTSEDNSRNTKKLFHKFMINRFGKEYIVDLLSDVADVSSEYIMEKMQKK